MSSDQQRTPSTHPITDLSQPVEPQIARPSSCHVIAVELRAEHTYTLALCPRAEAPDLPRRPFDLYLRDPSDALVAGATYAMRRGSPPIALTYTARCSGTYHISVASGENHADLDYFDLFVAGAPVHTRSLEAPLTDAGTDVVDLGDITQLECERPPRMRFHGTGERTVRFLFTLTQHRQVKMGLRRLDALVHLALEDPFGRTLCRRTFVHGDGEYLKIPLPAGTYCARVARPRDNAASLELRYAVGASADAITTVSQTRGAGARIEEMHPRAMTQAIAPANGTPIHVLGERSRVSLGCVSSEPESQTPRRFEIVRGNEADMFELDKARGELFFVGSESDFNQHTRGFELIVRERSGVCSKDHRVNVSVTNVPDTAPTDSDAGTTRPVRGRVSLGGVSETWPTSGPVKFRLVNGDEADLFELDETTGELFFTGSAEDFERLTHGLDLTVHVDAQRH